MPRNAVRLFTAVLFVACAGLAALNADAEGPHFKKIWLHHTQGLMTGLTVQQDIRWPQTEPTYRLFEGELYDHYDWGGLLGQAIRTEQGPARYEQGPICDLTFVQAIAPDPADPGPVAIPAGTLLKITSIELIQNPLKPDNSWTRITFDHPALRQLVCKDVKPNSDPRGAPTFTRDMTFVQFIQTLGKWLRPQIAS